MSTTAEKLSAAQLANDLREHAAEARFPENEDTFVHLSQGEADEIATLLDAHAGLLELVRECREALKATSAVCIGETFNKNGLVSALELARDAMKRADSVLAEKETSK